jgi:formylglycine-generating enzyme required for sulfatase activity
MAESKKGKSRRSQQVIKAVKGSTISEVIQAVVNGDVTGDVHIGDKIYNRSELEELNDYLTKAVFAFESKMYQTLRQQISSGHPYKFLQSFTLEDADMFFGRDDAIEEIHKRVTNDRLTVLHARSGAGKTSILNAGLSPRLIREARLPICVHTRPLKEDPVRDLKRAIMPPSLGPWPKLLADLSMHEFLGLVCTHLSRQTLELVIIFDQFEQFLKSLEDPTVRLPFIKILGDCYEDRTLPVRFIISLRHENVGDLVDEFESFIPRILQNRYRLLPMTEAEIRKAITGPIARLQKGISIEPKLLELLIETLSANEVELTHLQIVCTKLYDALAEGEKVISVHLYQSLGEAEGILTHYLDDTLSTLPDYKKLVARNILKALVSSEATNRILPMPDLLAVIPPDVSVVEDVLQYLIDTRLLRQDETLEGKEYELAHAYLAEEVYHWVGQDEIENKQAQELLQRELANWRVHETIVDEEKLNILRGHLKYLRLDPEVQQLLLQSALEQGHDVSFWLEQVEGKQEALQQIAARLGIVDQQLGRKIADDLKAKLGLPLQPYFLSLLWTIYNQRSGRGKQDFAVTLWAFGPWLSPQEKIRTFPDFARGWARLNPRLLTLFLSLFVAFVVTGVLISNALSQERAVPGRWVTIPAGPFVMGMDEEEAKLAASLCEEGASEKDKCDTWEDILLWSGRQVGAELPRFDILDNEVTNAQYRQCVDAGSCQPPSDWRYEAQDFNQPATNLNWFQAQAYCEWLGGRLPTEGEWEKAARGPENTTYPWGDWDEKKANIEHSGITNVQHIVQDGITDISGYNVKNLAGNVREWTASAAFNVAVGQAFTNEVFPPPNDGGDFPMIVRGGSWINERSTGMASYRGGDGVLSRRVTLGFRCVCPEEQQPCDSPWNLAWKWFGK